MRLKKLCVAAITASAALAFNPLAAQTLSPEAQYQQDLMRCQQEQSIVDINACKKEAAAALQATRAHTLGNGQGTDFQANERNRCMALPENQRDDCLLLLSEQNTQTTGSVSEGGVLRETTITIPAPAQVPGTSTTPSTFDGTVTSPVRP